MGSSRKSARSPGRRGRLAACSGHWLSGAVAPQQAETWGPMRSSRDAGFQLCVPDASRTFERDSDGRPAVSCSHTSASVLLAVFCLPALPRLLRCPPPGREQPSCVHLWSILISIAVLLGLCGEEDTQSSQTN